MPGLSLLGYCSNVLETGMLLWGMGARINTSNIFGEESRTITSVDRSVDFVPLPPPAQISSRSMPPILSSTQPLPPFTTSEGPWCHTSKHGDGVGSEGDEDYGNNEGGGEDGDGA